MPWRTLGNKQLLLVGSGNAMQSTSPLHVSLGLILQSIDRLIGRAQRRDHVTRVTSRTRQRSNRGQTSAWHVVRVSNIKIFHKWHSATQRRHTWHYIVRRYL